MNSLTDDYSGCVSDIMMAALLWVYSVQHCQFNDVLLARKDNNV